MPIGKQYPKELRDRATRMAIEARQNPDTATLAVERIGEQLGINPNTLRTWVRKVEKAKEKEQTPIGTVSDIEIVRKLQQENAELRRANEILKAASTFFAAELDRPQH